jgi:hypothetical protein
MKPVIIPNTFQTQAGPIPLAQFDADYTAISAVVNDFGTYGNYLLDTGAVNTWVASIPASTTFSLVAGVPVQVKVAVTTTSTTPTLNVNGTGAKTIVQADGSAPPAGQFIAGQIVSLIYDGTNYRAMGFTANNPPQTSGSFVATLTGTTGASGAVLWTVQGNTVVLTITEILGTSNTNTCSLTGLPANIIPPTTSVNLLIPVFFNATVELVGQCSATITAGSGTITFGLNGSSTGFTPTGAKGPTACTLVYSLI